MFQKINRKNQLKFSPIDKMYLASGCYNFHIGEPKIDNVKQQIRNDVATNNPRSYQVREIEIKFPTITNLYDKEIFQNQGDISKYFELLGDINKDWENKENCSHNVKLYLEGLQRGNLKGFPENDLIKALETYEGCAVKVVDTQKNKIWGFGGIYENLPLDFEYFGKQEFSRYALSHGSSSKGFVLIRSISEEEFEKFKNWFETIQQVPNNPFTPRKNQLETMLKENYFIT